MTLQPPDGLGNLIDRAAIADLLNGYAYGIDRHDWPLYRSIFTDELAIDLAWSGLGETMSADAWVAIVKRTLEPFDATLHRMTNIMITLAGDHATLAAQMTARHMIEIDGAQQIHMLGGRYEPDVVRTSHGWRIAKLRLVVTMEQGDRSLFEIASARAAREHIEVADQALTLGSEAA